MIQQGSELVVRYAARLRAILVLVLLATVAAEAWALWNEFAALGLHGAAANEVAASERLKWVCDLLSAIAVSAGLIYLIHMAGAFSRTGRMIPEVTENLKGFAYCVLVAAGATSVLPFAIALSMQALAGSRVFSVAVEGSDLLLLLAAGVMVPITHLMAIANLAQDELDRIV